MYLSVEAIQPHLETEILGKVLEVHKKAPSTNDLAWAAAKEGKEEGFVVFAEQQTAGRGRQGKNWFAPRASSLLVSILLRPPAITCAPALTIGAALAVCRACEANTSAHCQVKWPNDVLIGGKKVAGILVESRVIEKSLPIYVVGIGLNVNLSRLAFPKELRETATSLRAATKKMYDRNKIAISLLQEFDKNYLLAREHHWGGLEVEFFSRLGLTDQQVELKTSNKTHRGLLRAISMDEGITIEVNSGRRTFPCEHVLALSLWGRT